jgi:hypothetical protein
MLYQNELPLPTELGFVPKYKELSKDQAELFLQLCILGKDFEIQEMPFLSKIVQLRVEVNKLPIKLTNQGLMAVNCFAHNPGAAVILLIDFISNFENEELNCDNLAKLYPVGFYTEESMEDLIDNYLKTKQTKWSRLY